MSVDKGGEVGLSQVVGGQITQDIILQTYSSRGDASPVDTRCARFLRVNPKFLHCEISDKHVIPGSTLAPFCGQDGVVIAIYL